MENLKQKIYCERCKRRTNHGILHKHTIEGGPPEDLSWEENFYISICLGCDCVNFVSIYTDETMVSFNPFDQEYEYFEDIKVHPPEPEKNIEVLNTHSEKNYKNLPENISVLYKEVVKAYNTNLYLLSAIGLRMIVEGMCNELNINDGYVMDEETGIKKVNNDGDEIRNKTLLGKINGMVEKGVVLSQQARILHQIRNLGNQTVHELKKPSGRTILKGIDIIESILHVIYELGHFNIIKK